MRAYPPATDGSMFEHMPTDKLPLNLYFFSLLFQISVKSVQITVQTLQQSFTFHSLWRLFSLLQHSTSVYGPALLDISPIFHVFSSSVPRHQHPVDNCGLFSFMTLHWLSPLALKAYKASSLSIDDVWGLSCHEASETNCQR